MRALDTIQERRERLMREAARRNEPAARRAFWDRKRADRGAPIVGMTEQPHIGRI